MATAGTIRSARWGPAAYPRTLDFAAHEPLVEVVRAFVEDDLAATRTERGLPG